MAEVGSAQLQLWG